MQFREWFTVSTTPVVLPVCSNGVDDDGDGGVDFPADPGCDSATDGEESPDPAPPVPTAAGQCKDSGWMSYPHLAFKNQGDCVSYVVTHGRNEPGQNRP